jgi:hypothetical protein
MKFITNVVQVLAETFRAPLKQSFIDLQTGEIERLPLTREYTTLGSGTTKVGRLRADLKPAFKLAVLIVVAITVLSGIAEIVLADIWPNPKSNQQSTFEGFNFAWKAGIGAILGLVGGKVT